MSRKVYHQTLLILGHFGHSKRQLRLLVSHHFLKCFNFGSYLRVPLYILVQMFVNVCV